ncbi:MAG TPA: GNAT family N-acetyltransferase, partial [Thermoanaerobaculia bacterium]|nr:GNAT family N-acetyltransferase [Thermoanaerobaculia bacterium]
MIALRLAKPEEAEWVNARYAEVRFLPSDLARETVVIAEIDGQPAGLGRLVPVDDESCELGGMLVFEPFRGRGVARAIIDELLRHANARAVYCIPFAELEPLYAAAGFARTANAPAAVMEKYEWCTRTYDKPVVLMR